MWMEHPDGSAHEDRSLEQGLVMILPDDASQSLSVIDALQARGEIAM